MSYFEGIGNGVAIGNTMIATGRIENSVRVGARNHYLISLLLSAQWSGALKLGNKALDAAKYSQITGLTSWAIWSVPFLLTYLVSVQKEEAETRVKNIKARSRELVNEGVDPQEARAQAEAEFKPTTYEATRNQIILTLYSNAGRAAQVAAIASSIALITLGQTALGGAALGMLALGFFERWLPDTVRFMVNGSASVIFYAITLIYGGWFEAGISLIALLNIAFPHTKKYVYDFIGKAFGALDSVNLNPMAIYQLTEDDFSAIEKTPEDFGKTPVNPNEISDMGDLQLNPGHILTDVYESIPEPPEDIDMSELLEMFDEIDWSKEGDHFKTLQDKLADDDRWMEFHQAGESIFRQFWNYLFPPEKIEPEVAHLRKQFTEVVQSIKYHDIQQGEGNRASYVALEKYMKWITHELRNRDEKTRANNIIALGIEGGEYCGPGKFTAIAKRCHELMKDSGALSIERRTYLILESFRDRLFEEYYSIFVGPIMEIQRIMQERAGSISIRESFNIIYGREGETLIGALWKTFLLTLAKGLLNLCDFQDVHTYNQFRLLGGKPFGLPDFGEKHDETAVMGADDAFLKAVYQKWARWFLHGDEYGLMGGAGPHKLNTGSVLGEVQEQVGQNVVPLADFTKWMRDWIVSKLPEEIEGTEEDKAAYAAFRAVNHYALQEALLNGDDDLIGSFDPMLPRKLSQCKAALHSAGHQAADAVLNSVPGELRDLIGHRKLDTVLQRFDDVNNQEFIDIIMDDRFDPKVFQKISEGIDLSTRVDEEKLTYVNAHIETLQNCQAFNRALSQTFRDPSFDFKIFKKIKRFEEGREALALAHQFEKVKDYEAFLFSEESDAKAFLLENEPHLKAAKKVAPQMTRGVFDEAREAFARAERVVNENTFDADRITEQNLQTNRHQIKQEYLAAFLMEIGTLTKA